MTAGIVERLRFIAEALIEPPSGNIGGIRVEAAKNACEAAQVIETLANLLRRSHGAIQDAFGQADAEARDHMKTATKYETSLRTWQDEVRAFLASLNPDGGQS